MLKVFFLFLSLFAFGFCLEAFQNDLERKAIKTHPIAVKETLSQVDSKNIGDPIISETLEIYDSMGMIIFKLVQKTNQLEKNKPAKITSYAYIRSYNGKQLVETINIFGKPLRYTVDSLAYAQGGQLLSIVTKDERSNVIASKSYEEQDGFLVKEKESSRKNGELSKETNYQYSPNFQVKSLQKILLSKDSSKPIINIDYDYLNKERNMFYNRRTSVNQIDLKNNKNKAFSYKEVLIAKDGFFIKYLLDKNSHVIGKSQIDLDTYGNAKKITIYENDLPKYTLDFLYFNKDKEKFLSKILEKISSSNVIGPKNLEEAKEFSKKLK